MERGENTVKSVGRVCNVTIRRSRLQRDGIGGMSLMLRYVGYVCNVTMDGIERITSMSDEYELQITRVKSGKKMAYSPQFCSCGSFHENDSPYKPRFAHSI